MGGLIGFFLEPFASYNGQEQQKLLWGDAEGYLKKTYIMKPPQPHLPHHSHPTNLEFFKVI
jgi:hypothetical protein